MLTLPEELLLLAITDREGTVVHSGPVFLHLGLAGAMMIELAINGRLVIHKGTILVVDSSPTKDEILDEVLITIKKSSQLNEQFLKK